MINVQNFQAPLHSNHGYYGYCLSHSMKPLSLQQVIRTSLDKPVVPRRALPTSRWEFYRAVSASAFGLADLVCFGGIV